VDHDVNLVEFLLDGGKYRFDLGVVGDVALEAGCAF